MKSAAVEAVEDSPVDLIRLKISLVLEVTGAEMTG